MTVANLFARIGLKTDEEKAKSFSRSMKVAKTTLIGVTAAAAGAALAIRKVSKDAMDAAAALKQMNTETGVSTTQLQKWQQVAEQTNQSAESVNAAIKAITSNQEKIKLGQGNISGFQLLGIDPTQDPFEILEQLRDKTDGLSEAMKRNILAQTGVGAGMLQTLSLSREEFDAMASRAFIISPQAIETLNSTKAAMDHAGRGLQYLKTQIAVSLAPQIKKLSNDFIRFIKVNEEGFIKGFKKAFDILTKFIGAVGNVGRLINNLVTGTIGWNNALKILIGTIAIMNASLLLSPIGLITAGIILLVAVIDDLYIYSKGGKSIFGLMMEGIKNSKLMEWITGFIDKIKEMYQTVTNTFDKIMKFKEELGANIEVGMESQAASGFGGGYAQGLANMTNIKNDITINNTGDNNSQEIADHVRNALQAGYNGASAQMGRNE